MTPNRSWTFAVAASLVTAHIVSAPPAWSQTPQWNMYSDATTGLVIPYLPGPDRSGALNSSNGDGTFSNQAASFNVSIAGSRPVPVTIDTGSTGIAIAQNYLPAGALNGLTPIGPGAINYDSSGNTPTGYFYELPVNLLGGKVNSQAAVGTTTVKVLVVTSDNTTAYFGIGNNRNNVYSGVSNPSLSFTQNVAQGNLTQISAVGMNPLINVAVNGTLLANQGYVVSNNQIVVGLTTSNNTYSFVKLTPDAGAAPNLWNGIPVALSNGTGKPYAAGTILHDTGINNAYLKPFGVINDTVSVSMPGAPDQIQGAFYSFVVPQAGTTCGTLTAVTPCQVLESTSTTPFLNTGRQFYSAFDMLFDPVNGYTGYALSTSGLAPDATLSPLLALIGNVSLPTTFFSDFPTFLMGATTLYQDGVGTIQGNISGSGGLTIGSGWVNLTGANTYFGGTTVTGGAILGINADSGLGDLSGGLTLNNGTLLARADISSSRAVALGAGGGTFNTNGNNIALTGGVTGIGGLTKAGNGILKLEGVNSYTGGTTVAAGTLDLTGTMIGSLSILAGATFTTTGGWSLAAGAFFNNAGTFQSLGGGPLVNQGMLVNNGTMTTDLVNSGRLSGIGTIIGTVTNNGIVAPGNSIGTLSVVGSYTQASGSTYQVETNSAGQADRINVSGASGTATINGGTVTLTEATGVYAPSTTYTILNATGGVTGAYAGANSLFPFLQPSLSYDANNVYLTLKPGGFTLGAQTANQSAVGRVLDLSVAGSSGDFATVIGTMATYTLAQGQAAMAALSGQNYSGFSSANLGGSLLFMNALGQQMGAARGTGSNRASRTALALACDVACDAEGGGAGASPWSVWGSAMGGTSSVAGNANTATLTYNAGGVATGIDYRFDPRFLAGVGVGFASGSQSTSGFSGQGTTTSYQASLYASFTQAAFYLDGLAGYGYNDNQMTRQIVLPNLAARIAQGRTGANQFLGQAEAGYRIGLYEPAAASITPFARFQGTTVSQMGFTESGAGALNLNVTPQTTGSARSVLGAELAGAFGAEGREKLAMQLRLGWAHEYANTVRPVTANFAGAPGTNFTVFGAAPQRDAATVSLAANTAIAAGASLYLRYDGEMATGTNSHSLNGGLRMTW